MIIKFIFTVFLYIGLICTLAPRFHGTLIILAITVMYSMLTNFDLYHSWILLPLIICMFAAEIVALVLRIYTTKNIKLSRAYSVNTSVCNIGASFAASILLTPNFGFWLWQLIVGKTIWPRINTISAVLTRLNMLATFRWLLGFIMLILVLKNVIYL